MHNNLTIGRQPIIDQNEEVIGYEFFYRDQYGECTIDDPRHATASVLVNILNQIGSEASMGNLVAFINTDGPLLLTDILRTLPKEKFVFEISSKTKMTSRIHEAIRYFHSLGYQFALDNASFDPHYLEMFSPLFSYMAYAKFDVTQTDIEQFQLDSNPYKEMRCIAQKVEFYDIAEEYGKIGFEAFQGFYFAKPHIITKRRIDPKYKDVMCLYTLLQNDDPIEDIITLLDKEHILSVQLIQFVRSIHPDFLASVTSMREILEKLGKFELLQWLMLIIYSKSGLGSGDTQNVHSVFAKDRVQTMLSILHLTKQDTDSKLFENVKLIALFSLLEGLMNVPLATIMKAIRPDELIEDAMISHSGILGRIYAATLKIEEGDFSTATLLLKPYGITSNDLMSLKLSFLQN